MWSLDFELEEFPIQTLMKYESGTYVRAVEDIVFNGKLTILKGTTGRVGIPTAPIQQHMPILDGVIGVSFDDSVNGMTDIMIEEDKVEPIES